MSSVLTPWAPLAGCSTNHLSKALSPALRSRLRKRKAAQPARKTNTETLADKDSVAASSTTTTSTTALSATPCAASSAQGTPSKRPRRISYKNTTSPTAKLQLRPATFEQVKKKLETEIQSLEEHLKEIDRKKAIYERRQLQKQETEKVNVLRDKWKEACQQVATDLFAKLQGMHSAVHQGLTGQPQEDLTMTRMLQEMGVDSNLLNYSEEEETFL
ncbi:hypothetical protein QOT17_024382 [Balamuthia mandrillaris]